MSLYFFLGSILNVLKTKQNSYLYKDMFEVQTIIEPSNV